MRPGVVSSYLERELEAEMTPQHIETLIVGGGQAGLTTGYYLRKLGRPFLIVEAEARIGDQWRNQWDTLRLYSPAKFDGLPGLPFPADDWSFPSKDEVADYVESYALTFDLPVRTNTRVDLVEPHDHGGYIAHIGAETVHCDAVVVATGTLGRTPVIPTFANELDESIVQLHSSEYRRSSQLHSGRVLVVGASHSGTDIAYEVAQTHDTVLAGRDCGQFPARVGTSGFKVIFPIFLFATRHLITRRTPLGRKMIDDIRHHGGPMLRVSRQDLAQRGVERLTGRVTGVRDGLPVMDDGTVVDAANVIWATGFSQAFDWIKLPVFEADGWPREYRGKVTEAEGLYFAGLCMQYSFSSMFIGGVGRDSAFVAHDIDRTARQRDLAIA
jgi:putative flavoprotein involved in K+ transport